MKYLNITVKKILIVIVWLYIVFLVVLKTNPIISTGNLQASVLETIDINGEIINIIPFKTIVMYLINFEHYNFSTAAAKLFFNIIIYIPLGALIKLLLDEKKKIALIGIFISFNVELVKIISLTGYWDIDTVILNTVGFIFGIGIICLMNKLNRKIKRL